MVYLIPTNRYIERLVALLRGEAGVIFLNYIAVGWEPSFWDNLNNRPKIPNIFLGRIVNVYNEGLIPANAYVPISAEFKAENPQGGSSSGNITYGYIFKLRFKGVLSAIPPYWDESINRLIIEVGVPSGTVNINAVELSNNNGESICPLFLVSVPLIPISVGTIADWDLELLHNVVGAVL